MPTVPHLLDIVCWHAKMNKVLVLLIGPPCSGKSSFDALLQDRLPHTTVNTDNSVDPRVVEERSKYFQRLYDEALMAGNHIVVDQTNCRPEERKQRLAQAPNHLHMAIDFANVPYAALVVRNKLRQYETGRVMPSLVIWDLLQAYRPPQVDEGFDYIFKVNQE